VLRKISGSLHIPWLNSDAEGNNQNYFSVKKKKSTTSESLSYSALHIPTHEMGLVWKKKTSNNNLSAKQNKKAAAPPSSVESSKTPSFNTAYSTVRVSTYNG